MPETANEGSEQKYRQKEKKWNRLRPCGEKSDFKLGIHALKIYLPLKASADEPKVMRRRSQRRRKHGMSRLPSWSFFLSLKTFLRATTGEQKEDTRRENELDVTFWVTRVLREGIEEQQKVFQRKYFAAQRRLINSLIRSWFRETFFSLFVSTASDPQQ